MIVLIISGIKATVAELSLSPITRITGTCVAHIKFTRSTKDQSTVFAGLNKLIVLLLVYTIIEKEALSQTHHPQRGLHR